MARHRAAVPSGPRPLSRSPLYLSAYRRSTESGNELILVSVPTHQEARFGRTISVRYSFYFDENELTRFGRPRVRYDRACQLRSRSRPERLGSRLSRQRSGACQERVRSTKAGSVSTNGFARTGRVAEVSNVEEVSSKEVAAYASGEPLVPVVSSSYASAEDDRGCNRMPYWLAFQPGKLTRFGRSRVRYDRAYQLRSGSKLRTSRKTRWPRQTGRCGGVER